MKAGVVYLQPKFLAYSSYEEAVIKQHGRKWLMSKWMKENEVIQTGLAAALMSSEHQVRKNFHYQNKRLFGPHFNMNKLKEAVILSRNLDDQIDSVVSLKNIMKSISFPGSRFEYKQMDEDDSVWIQAYYTNPSVTLESANPKMVRGDKLFISSNDLSESKIVITAFKALISAAKQEVVSNYLVDGEPIFDNELLELEAVSRVINRGDHLEQRAHPGQTKPKN